MIGRVLGNRYEIIEQLGGGGMAVVYKARDRFLGRLVTVKVLRPEYTSDPDFVRRFRREAQAVASLSHPNIVSIYDVGQEDGIHYLVMEYVGGESLKDLIQRCGPLEPEYAADIARQVCRALEHAHARQIVHRDVKPHNILLTPEGRAKLTDFGIARELHTGTITYADGIIGTAHYLPPEQVSGGPVGPQGDLYSLGVVLYEMLTGQVPFAGDTPVAVALKHVREEIPSLAAHGLPGELARIVARATAKDPARRYRRAAEMEQDLAGFLDLDERPEYAPVREADYQPPVRRKLRERALRRRRPALLLAGTLLLVAGLLVGGWYALRHYLHGAEVIMPNVENLPVAVARATLEQVGLTNITVTSAYHNTVAEGLVIDQDPAPDTTVKKSRPVRLVVSLGPQLFRVPDVRGKTEADARLALENAHMEALVEEISSNVPRGLVVDQNPAGGTPRPAGTRVHLLVSKGPEPALRTVPDLTGLSLDQARNRLAQAGLLLDEAVVRQPSDRYLQGQVMAQDPPPQTGVPEGSAVRVTVSSGPGPPPREATVEVEVPSDGRNHEVRIVVSDVRGETPAYINTHRPGEKVVKTVVYYGRATVRVYLDQQLLREKTF
ncbi:MAG: protein kinase domain-containing protein [Desulfotomaculales bacterium]